MPHPHDTDYKRPFFDPQVVLLALVLMIGLAIILVAGELIAPLLASVVVNLHPIAIITALLVFGGVWGFWGVFFAIPLATLIAAVLKAWPSAGQVPNST